MYQEDGRLCYIEGVDNGDAPAHDGTFEAGHAMNHVILWLSVVVNIKA